MGDLIGFEGYLNVSTPFDRKEHNALWKGDRRYNDFAFGNKELPHCDYPRFYGDDGNLVLNLTSELVGCRDSEFDQYGEVAAFGIYPEWYVFLEDWLFSNRVAKHAPNPLRSHDSYMSSELDKKVRCKYADSKPKGNVRSQNSHLCKIACASGNQRFSAKLSASLV